MVAETDGTTASKTSKRQKKAEHAVTEEKDLETSPAQVEFAKELPVGGKDNQKGQKKKLKKVSRKKHPNKSGGGTGKSAPEEDKEKEGDEGKKQEEEEKAKSDDKNGTKTVDEVEETHPEEGDEEEAEESEDQDEDLEEKTAPLDKFQRMVEEMDGTYTVDLGLTEKKVAINYV